jgi:hypothetical protein
MTNLTTTSPIAPVPSLEAAPSRHVAANATHSPHHVFDAVGAGKRLGLPTQLRRFVQRGNDVNCDQSATDTNAHGKVPDSR